MGYEKGSAAYYYINERNGLIALGALLLYLTVLAGDTMYQWVSADSNTWLYALQLGVAICVFACMLWGGVNLIRAILIQRHNPGKEESVWRAAAGVLCFGFVWSVFASPLSAYGQSLHLYQWVLRDIGLLFFGVALGVITVAIALDTARRVDYE